MTIETRYEIKEYIGNKPFVFESYEDALAAAATCVYMTSQDDTLQAHITEVNYLPDTHKTSTASTIDQGASGVHIEYC